MDEDEGVSGAVRMLMFFSEGHLGMRMECGMSPAAGATVSRHKITVLTPDKSRRVSAAMQVITSQTITDEL